MAHAITQRLRGAAAALVALLACLAIVPTAAFADSAAFTSNSLTVDGLVSGDTVTIYQVVETTYDGDTNVASNAFVANFGVDYDDWADAEGTSEIQNYADTIAAYVNSHADEWGTGGHVMYTATSTGNSVTFNDIAAGQYLVVVSNANDATRVYQTVIMSVIPTVDDGDFVPAESETTLKCTDMDSDTDSVVDKKINGGDSTDTVDANDTVTFTITSQIPYYTSNLDSRMYTLTDTMSDGFVYTANSLSVSAGSTQLTEGTDYTVNFNQDGTLFVLSLTKSALETYANQTLTISYEATIASGANTPSYGAAETNAVTLVFSINSIDSETSTATDTVYMTVYGITFKKVGEDETSTGLAGAEFEVQDAGGNVVATAESDENGDVTITGALAADQQYTLVETVAPTGYDLMDDMTFTIKSDVNSGYSGYLYKINKGTVTDPVAGFLTDLPTTGGTGTIIMTAAGVVLIAGAAALIARSRKQD